MLSYSKPYIIKAAQAHTATMIIVHGLGDSGHGWTHVALYLKRYMPHIKFVLPHAPARRITINGGMAMPGWYDICDLGNNIERKQDEEGMMESRRYIQGLIDEEIRSGIPSDRIVLGGFSQGGAMTLLTGLTCPHKLAGLAVLSGYLPIHKKIFSLSTDQSKSVPIFQVHGEVDQVIDFSLAEQSQVELKKNEYNVEFHKYPDMGHEACQEEVSHLLTFLKKIIPEKQP
ncbi:hypothetical protein EV182_002103 [Spiromyces aspiralis]|uniref:Uncharacterized protein n=1 Tax=Spiromyces aspiralis TaxID=68401 RepID=A0ACC1HUI0_9FUNG|nr:hypothetical protein EV182_002103 [Spiromyces aspiralis]